MRAGLVPESLPPLDHQIRSSSWFEPAWLRVGFAVSGVAAGEDGHPEAAGHLLTGEVAPALREVAFVHHLVEEDGLVPVAEPVGRLRRSWRSGGWRG